MKQTLKVLVTTLDGELLAQQTFCVEHDSEQTLAVSLIDHLERKFDTVELAED